jgi:hypothetical protein
MIGIDDLVRQGKVRVQHAHGSGGGRKGEGAGEGVRREANADA